MSAINTEQLAALAEIFKEAEGMEEHFKKFKTIYKNYFHYDQPVNVLEKVAKINQKLGGKSEPTDNESNTEKTQSFAFGELKVFTWALTVYCYHKKLTLQQINENHLKDIQNIFPNKSVPFIRYQIMCLAHQKSKFAPQWSQPQIEMLTKIVNSKQTLCEWRQISYQLFCNSENKFYRPFQHCRQKWFNHLDPKVRKGKWTLEEDIALLTAVECLDCKWIQIYRELSGVRTQHMIKNRYKSLLKKWKKKYEKTSPTKIVSLVLKHLKTKLKKGDLNSSMSSNEHEEVPIPLKPKKGKHLNARDMLESASLSRSHENSSEQSSSFGSSSSGNSGPSFKVESRGESHLSNESSEFDLGLGSNVSWKVNIDHGSESLEERALNAMIVREEEYGNEVKNNKDRKTTDSDEFPIDNYDSNAQDFFAQLDNIGPSDNQLFEVEGFQDLEDMRMRIIDNPNEEWPYWEDKLDMNDFDLSDY